MSTKQMNLTTFGVYAKKLRADHNEYSKDMASRLSITPSYLSAVEHGRRSAPYDWVERLTEAYALTKDEMLDLSRAVSESRLSDSLDISHLSFDEKRVVRKLVTSISNLTPETITKLKGLLTNSTIN